MTINLRNKYSQFNEHWHPYIIGELNENYVKLAKVKGEFVWHSHADEDELFIVVGGTLMMDFRDKTVSIQPGEILIVPKGVEHRPWTKDGEEVQLMLIEPKATKHTGEVVSDLTVNEQQWL
jgi:mannose-6-phosphate isomerase-like protein (cupin superfamily)